jgi:hypothetical protein
MAVRIPAAVFEDTFTRLRTCGDGQRECQSLWVGPWATPDRVTRSIHPAHTASAVGFQLDPAWLNEFWEELAAKDEGVRVQIHTHPGAAYHSAIDDAFPMLTTPGFLSLVIPRFAQGPLGFQGAFLAQLSADMRWREVPIHDHLEIEQ